METYTEINGDLFQSKISKVHCVSADMKMGAGIAKIFREKYGNIDFLKQQKAKVGDIAVLRYENEYIFYLVTKEKYWQKPTYETLEKSLIHLKIYCNTNNINEISIPKIGCGLDKLNWNKVRNMIKRVLKDLKVFVYIL